ncbi:MAG: histidine kinase [Saprospiraceae bacterium]|nr:histidine kinase [Saprospiraceae bacterium]
MAHQKQLPYGFDDRWLMLFGIPIIGFLMPPIFFDTPVSFDTYYFRKSVVSMFYTMLYWGICRQVFIRATVKFPEYYQNSKRILWIGTLCIAIILTFCNVLHFCIEPYLGLALDRMPTTPQINAASLMTFGIIAGIYESVRNFNLWKKTSLEKEQLERENLQSQLAGLKSQVNPHFLFNSLNTLVHLIPENPDSAIKFVQKLSKVYRYILEMRDAPTTPLSTELEFLNAYVFLLKERFGDNLKVEIADAICLDKVHQLAQPLMDSAKSTCYSTVCEKHIVPLSLQILFENAIKHNIISAQRPLTISVSIENNERLIVKNNLQRKNQIQEGTGVGLQNIRNRYQLVSQKDVDIIVTQESFIVSLPLLKTENQLVTA